MLDPVPAPAAGQPVLGQRQPDMGRLHVTIGTPVTYNSCPPASGPHYNSSGLGPIAPRFYGPDDATVPQGWVHNLEHGGFVILYSCAVGGCDQSSLDRLRQLVATFPPSPLCKVPGGIVSPVIARFDEMKRPFAAVLWDRVLLQDALDVPQILQFFADAGEQLNPESYCVR
jgi:hypothetical protein